MRAYNSIMKIYVFMCFFSGCSIVGHQKYKKPIPDDVYVLLMGFLICLVLFGVVSIIISSLKEDKVFLGQPVHVWVLGPLCAFGGGAGLAALLFKYI